jgi:hypothetical protein
MFAVDKVQDTQILIRFASRGIVMVPIGKLDIRQSVDLHFAQYEVLHGWWEESGESIFWQMRH